MQGEIFIFILNRFGACEKKCTFVLRRIVSATFALLAKA